MMNTTPQSNKSLSDLAERARKDYERELASIFDLLKEHDQEVATAALELIGSPSDAVAFLAKPVSEMKSESLLQQLEKGNRKDVLSYIGRLEHGVY